MSFSFSYPSTGDHWIRVSGTDGNDTDSDSVFIHVLDTEILAPLPGGVRDGINYIDDQSAHLVLHAPGKEHAFVIGDFNDWAPVSAARMNKDGERFWITLDNLETGKEYAFQYMVDGRLFIADPYTEKVLDPKWDKDISASTYPGLKAYPSRASGIVGILESGQSAYPGTMPDFSRPIKKTW